MRSESGVKEMATLEERAARKEAELNELNARLAKKKAKEQEQHEKMRTNAGMQTAGVVWEVLGLNEDTFDLIKFKEQLEACAKGNWRAPDGTVYPMFDCAAPKVDLKETKKRWRECASALRKRS